MKIHLIAVGTRMPSWVEEGFKEYQKRMPGEYALILHEITPDRRLGKGSLDKIRQHEGAAILNAVPRRAYVVALDEHGVELSSVDLAAKLKTLQAEYADLALLVGGPEGLADECKTAAREMWSLSRLTLPHPLVRVILAETLYRAYSITAGLPYHRA